ncbi:hypothetical protein AC1031_010725 [Aphanomyces cochlioides]|nr:hypothetical protein AC1031_010725 [Aphanomyces cochlioides]
MLTFQLANSMKGILLVLVSPATMAKPVEINPTTCRKLDCTYDPTTRQCICNNPPLTNTPLPPDTTTFPPSTVPPTPRTISTPTTTTSTTAAPTSPPTLPPISSTPPPTFPTMAPSPPPSYPITCRRILLQPVGVTAAAFGISLVMYFQELLRRQGVVVLCLLLGAIWCQPVPSSGHMGMLGFLHVSHRQDS